MTRSAIFVRAAILSAATSGCCYPTRVGVDLVPVSPSTLGAIRAQYRAAEKQRKEPSSAQEEDLAVCNMICSRSRHEDIPFSKDGYPGSDCKILRLRSPVIAAPAAPKDPRAVSKEPPVAPNGPPVASNGPPAAASQPEDIFEYAATCELWMMPTCGRRPADWQSPAAAERQLGPGAYLALSARLEADSVQAFEDLASDLRRFSAPTRLVRAALRAAEDERRHARSMTAAAHEHGAEVPPAQRSSPTPLLDLEGFARNNAVEGCAFETFGAALAHRSARLARDPEIRRLFRGIARDETRHAMLSWEIFRWASRRLDAGARARVMAEHRRALQSLCTAPSVADRHARASLGLPDEGETRAIAVRLAESLSRHELMRSAA